MKSKRQSNERQPEKRNVFTVITNVRAHCKQTDGKKLLMMVLASYSNGDGLCFPGNLALADAMNKTDRTVRRMLKQLKAGGELEILRPGIGRGQQRIIRLTRYATIKQDKAVSGKGDKAMSGLNRTRSLGKTSRNTKVNHQLTPKGKGATTSLRSARTVSFFVPKVRYPETDEEMYDTLERLGIDINPDHDGNFFEQMRASDWTIQGNPVFDWPKTYEARLEVTMP
jgi:hypothetical protein